MVTVGGLLVVSLQDWISEKMGEKHCKAYSTNGWLKQRYSSCGTKSVLKRPDPAVTQNVGVEVMVSIWLVRGWISIFYCSGHG